MKVTYQTCCGVDVHKSFLVATIVKTTGGIEPSYQKKRFSTFNNSILEFKQWLLDNHCHDVCMESTGKYWVPVFNLLEDKINVVIANPKWVKAVKGNKDDTKDLILSILVDTFISKISFPMQPGPEIGSISDA